MTTKNLIERLQTLLPYYNNQEGFHTSAEHDVLYADPTDEIMLAGDVSRMIGLGWFQEDVDYGEGEEDFEVKHYCQDEHWTYYT